MRRAFFVTTVILATLTAAAAVVSYFAGIHQGTAAYRLADGGDAPTLRFGFSDALIRVAYGEETGVPIGSTLLVSQSSLKRPLLGWWTHSLWGSSTSWLPSPGGSFMLRMYWFSVWPLVGLLALPGLYEFGYRAWRAKRLQARGCCPRCAYDLRGTEGVCPECGWSARQPAEKATTGA